MGTFESSTVTEKAPQESWRFGALEVAVSTFGGRSDVSTEEYVARAAAFAEFIEPGSPCDV